MDINRISAFLDAFEKEHIGYLLKIEVKGINLWHCIKKPIYHGLRHKYISTSSQVRKKNIRLYLIQKTIVYFLKLIWAFITKRNATLVVTNSANKLSKDEWGNCLDPFIDHLILSGTIKRYLYFEHLSNTISTYGTAVKRDFNNDGIRIPINFLKRFCSKSRSLKNDINILNQKIRDFANKEGYNIILPVDMLMNIVSRFLAELKWQSFVLRLLRPRRILIVDGIPDGLIVAAKKRGVKTYELQHGFISYVKSEYIISSNFRHLKNKMPVTDYVCVFGNYFKDFLLQSGFWDKENIIVLGSASVEKKRASSKPIFDFNRIEAIFTGQPSMFSHSKFFLHEMSKLSFCGKIYIKPHPLERLENINFYKKLVEDNKNKFAFVQPSENIMDSLNEKNLLISYYSTTLIEAAALGYPCITISTEAFPNGINDLFYQQFVEIFRPLQTPFQLVNLFKQLRDNDSFAKQWCENSYKVGSYFYAIDYFKNIKYFQE